MSERVEGSVRTNGIQVHYSRYTPSGRRTSPLAGLRAHRKPLSVVMLHAITENGMCWERVACALEKDYDIILPDSRGHGMSDAPEMGYGVDDRAGDVAGLIQALGLDRPVLIGHAMGAETAIGAAALYTDLVRGVILEDPPFPGRFWGSTPEERASRASQWGEEIRQQKTQPREQLLAQAREQHPDWSEQELIPWVEAKQQASPNAANMVLAPRRRWSDYVRQAECPLLLITGDPERGAIVNAQTAQEAAIFWKKGRAMNISHAGHFIRRDQFEAYMKAVREFLARID